MRRYLGLLLLGIACVACSQGGSEGIDLGTPSDQETGQDQAGMTGPGLSLLAGAVGGDGNVDDTGAAARFYSPAGMALDGAGNLYVADPGNHTIRKVVLATGV